MLTDTTEMDPIVFATTWNDVEKKANNYYLTLHENSKSYFPIELREITYPGHLVNAFSSILDVENWLNLG